MGKRRRAAKLCRRLDCPHLRPCPEPGHEPEAWEGSTRSKRLPPDWPRIRRRILRRDPICKVCDDALSTEVDHIDDPDDHSDPNLQGICSPCHKDKTQQEARAAKRGER